MSELANSRVWPVKEALKILDRLKQQNKTCAIFETGYGPSGLPHMGTIAEVVRTLMIKKAFDELAPKGITSKLIAFVDDMDGFRKVPANVPNQDMLKKHLGKPLTKVPDPFDQEESFAAYNSKRFAHLLDRLGCSDQITIYSSTKQYESGQFNSALLEVLKHHKEILKVMHAHLGEERRATYSPFMPISPSTGKVLQVAMEKYDIGAGTVTFTDEDGSKCELPVTDGHCKLQWKPDFGMRWHALGVDYELYGKDLASSVEMASKICRILGSTPPEGFQYEHFLSPDGGRVSKSKGNENLTLDQWWNYTPSGCLTYFLFQKPQTAKRMRLEDLPTYVDSFLQALTDYQTMTQEERMENGLYYIKGINHIQPTDLTYKLALSIACAIHPPSVESLISALKISSTDTLGLTVAKQAYEYYQHEVKSQLQIEPIPAEFQPYIKELISKLENCEYEAQALQGCFFAVAKAHKLDMGSWFKALYKALLGANQGPKLGSFCLMYGVKNVINKLN